MFGNPGKYQIPDLEKVKQIIKNSSKDGLEDLAEQLFPPTRPMNIHYKALSIMYHEQMISTNMEKILSKKDDRIGEYIKHLHKQEHTKFGGPGGLKSTGPLTKIKIDPA